MVFGTLQRCCCTRTSASDRYDILDGSVGTASKVLVYEEETVSQLHKATPDGDMATMPKAPEQQWQEVESSSNKNWKVPNYDDYQQEERPEITMDGGATYKGQWRGEQWHGEGILTRPDVSDMKVPLTVVKPTDMVSLYPPVETATRANGIMTELTAMACTPMLTAACTKASGCRTRRRAKV